MRTRRKKIVDLNTAKAYFSNHVEIHDNGCHLWTGGKNNIGYGMWRYDGKMRTVHRVMAKWEGHDIEGKIVYHTCDHYNCVNPEHLRVGTLFDKAKVMVDKGRAGVALSNINNQRTCIHCGVSSSPAVLGHYHNDKCKYKP